MYIFLCIFFMNQKGKTREGCQQLKSFIPKVGMIIHFDIQYYVLVCRITVNISINVD